MNHIIANIKNWASQLFSIQKASNQFKALLLIIISFISSSILLQVIKYTNEKDKAKITANSVIKFKKLMFVESPDIKNHIFDKIKSLEENNFYTKNRGKFHGYINEYYNTKLKNLFDSTMKFEDAQQLLEALHIVGEVGEELELLKHLGKSQERSNLDKIDDYINSTYVNAVNQALEREEFERARYLTQLGSGIINNVIFSPPVYEYNTSDHSRLLLTNEIFHHMTYKKASAIEGIQLINFILNNQYPSKYELSSFLEEFTSDNFFFQIKLYIAGVQLFNYNHYDDAIQIFSGISHETDNQTLKLFTNHMIIRCLFWEDYTNKDINITKDNLKLIKEIRAEMKSKKFTVDADYYIEELQNKLGIKKPHFAETKDATEIQNIFIRLKNMDYDFNEEVF